MRERCCARGGKFARRILRSGRIRPLALRIESVAHTSYKDVELVDEHASETPYDVAWKWQKARVSALAEQHSHGALNARQALIIVQHTPCYTLGTRSSRSNLKFSETDPPHPLYHTERGGEVTYHGPGQLTVYPILDLRLHGKDLHLYMRNLEEVVIRSLDLVSGIEGYRIPGLTGVWTSTGKIAAVGVRATRWITYHGVALNVDPTLEHFDYIVPCGIDEADVTSVVRHLSMSSGATYVVGEPVCSAKQRAMLMSEYSHAVQQACEEVFDVTLI